jgi:hypothetical protein
MSVRRFAPVIDTGYDAFVRGERHVSICGPASIYANCRYQATRNGDGKSARASNRTNSNTVAAHSRKTLARKLGTRHRLRQRTTRNSISGSTLRTFVPPMLYRVSTTAH